MDIAKGNFKWKLIQEENGTIISTIECSDEVMGEIIKILFKNDQGESCYPNEEIREILKEILDKNIISQDVLLKLTGISKAYLQCFLEGAIEPMETNKLIALTEIVQKLRY